jgi:glutathione synthase/RimK-type ligase-like ATP-grasp enzyme
MALHPTAENNGATEPNGENHAEESKTVAILFENDAWLTDLFDELSQREIPYQAFHVDDASLHLDRPPMFPLLVNRVSPSSYLRGHGPAIPFARAFLDLALANRVRVVNGLSSFHLETSKVAQHLLFRKIGVASPQTLIFNNRHQVREQANKMNYPAMLKPNCGGSGAFVREIISANHLVEVVEKTAKLFGPDHLLLLQEKVTAADGSVVRTEFIDGEFVYAIRAKATNTFNLCPADACERYAADPTAKGVEPRVEFESYLDIPSDAVAQAREIVREAGLDVGGVEFMEDADGRRWFIDINATSVYRDDVAEAFQVDAMQKLVDFIEREYHKELAKRNVNTNAPATSA